MSFYPFPSVRTAPGFVTTPIARAKAAPYRLPDKSRADVDCSDRPLAGINGRYFLITRMDHGYSSS
ncbi:hypothetical protein [Parabacteroides massiliensis]|uniref:hypothetical protein n=1 Tax=Parabacteroides massiliensis TaxID=1750560 RepID=UPI001ABF7488|nr:hypothetical protein [Parabacteroides massiliensis]